MRYFKVFATQGGLYFASRPVPVRLDTHLSAPSIPVRVFLRLLMPSELGEHVRGWRQPKFEANRICTPARQPEVTRSLESREARQRTCPVSVRRTFLLRPSGAQSAGR